MTDVTTVVALVCKPHSWCSWVKGSAAAPAGVLVGEATSALLLGTPHFVGMSAGLYGLGGANHAGMVGEEYQNFILKASAS